MARRPVTPDESLTADASFLATDSESLVYAFDGKAPGAGELMRVAPSLSWARIPMPGSLGHINSWLPDDHDGMAIVDTGMRMPTCADAWKALFKADLKGVALTRVFCTHLHPDHIGLAGWLIKKDGLELWMTRGELLTARMLLAEASAKTPPEVYETQMAAGWTAEELAGTESAGWGQFARVTHPLPISYRRIMDGDRLDFGKTVWTVITGSGHSPEHACLVDETNGVMISGDQVLPRISSNVSVNFTEPHADPLREWLDSIDKLLGALPADLLVCPAHGEPFYGLHTRLNALKREHLDRLERLHAFLAEPRRIIDCFGLLFNRKIEVGQSGLATGEATAHLRWLETERRARREMVDGVWRFSAI